MRWCQSKVLSSARHTRKRTKRIEKKRDVSTYRSSSLLEQPALRTEVWVSKRHRHKLKVEASIQSVRHLYNTRRQYVSSYSLGRSVVTYHRHQHDCIVPTIVPNHNSTHPRAGQYSHPGCYEECDGDCCDLGSPSMDCPGLVHNVHSPARLHYFAVCRSTMCQNFERSRQGAAR
jgi:hypothetical protein